MTFHSILFPNRALQGQHDGIPEPEFFIDLNLDQIVAAVTASKGEYDLKPFFHLPLRDVDDIAFRHEVMRDLEKPGLLAGIRAFEEAMSKMREHLVLAEKLHYRRQKERWFLDAIGIYCAATVRLAEHLSASRPVSRALSALRDYLNSYVASDGFGSLLDQTKRLAADLAAIHYSVLIKDLYVQVRRHDGEMDHSAQVASTFEKFKQSNPQDYKFNLIDSADMNHVEAAVLDQVAKLHPELFAELERYYTSRAGFADPAIVRFDREIQFYIAYLDHIAPLKEAGLNFCYPQVTRASKEVYDYEGFDLALAGKLIAERATPVCNDFHLKERERIVIVSGPNQGGKTTFARTFGQLHYLASLGCPVPGTRARLYLFDRLFTHFEREENVSRLQGKLQDDLIRVHRILERATPDSIIIMNEIFTSTTLRDAIALSKKIVAKIMTLDLLCVWVTFVDELASLGAQTVSMVSTVVPGNPALRTYRILRRPADGLAYAMSIAEKYRLTYRMLKERIEP